MNQKKCGNSDAKSSAVVIEMLSVTSTRSDQHLVAHHVLGVQAAADAVRLAAMHHEADAGGVADLRCGDVQLNVREHGVGQVDVANSRVCPCALLMVMAKAARTGNWRRCSVNGSVLSEDCMRMCGMNTLLPACLPVLISQSSTLRCMTLASRRVPLAMPPAGSGCAAR